MKPAAIILALVVVLAFIALRIFRTPNVAPPPPIYTVEQLYEGTRAVYESGLLPRSILGTGSMAPHIPAHPMGDKIVVAIAGIDSTKFEDLRAGDWVVYTGPKVVTMHRLGERSEAGFVVYGVANDRADDALVTAQNYIGRVAVVYRLP